MENVLLVGSLGHTLGHRLLGPRVRDELRPVAASLLRAADANADGVLEMSELRHSGPRRGERDGPRRQPTPPATPAPEAPPPRG